MKRRELLRTGGLLGLATAISGCNTGSSDTASPADSATGTSAGADTDQETTAQQQSTDASGPADRYFFADETGALGHLADETIPENAQTITNTATEADYDEMQRNDRQYPEGMEQGQLDMTVDEMIERAEEVYNNPAQELNADRAETLGIDLTGEDDEMTFVRALVKATQEAGIDSSGLANIVVNNIAEGAVDQIQPEFTDFKLSTLPATEAVDPDFQGHAGGVRETEYGDEYGNSGFRHMPGILQYEKNGETQVKYVEVTDAIDVTPTFFHVIRNPEDSLYREGLNQGTVNTTGGGNGIRFPEHYVTAFDYEKARQLESEDILGLEENNVGTLVGVGDYIGVTLFQLVDDMGITGYDNNPDINNTNTGAALDGTLVSDEFGQSIEEYVTNPSTEKRQYLENVARGMYQIQQQEGWEAAIALTGTLEDPEILPTDQETVNQVRQDRAYDEVRERVTA